MGQHHRPSCSAVVLMRVSRCRPSKRSDRMSTSYVLFLWFVICCQIAVRSRYSSKMLCHLVLLYQRYFFSKKTFIFTPSDLLTVNGILRKYFIPHFLPALLVSCIVSATWPIQKTGDIGIVVSVRTDDQSFIALFIIRRSWAFSNHFTWRRVFTFWILLDILNTSGDCCSSKIGGH